MIPGQRVLVMQSHTDGRGWKPATVLAQWWNCVMVRYDDGRLHVVGNQYLALAT